MLFDCDWLMSPNKDDLWSDDQFVMINSLLNLRLFHGKWKSKLLICRLSWYFYWSKPNSSSFIVKSMKTTAILSHQLMFNIRFDHTNSVTRPQAFSRLRLVFKNSLVSNNWKTPNHQSTNDLSCLHNFFM